MLPFVLYLGGYSIDRALQFNVFIGGLLPYVGWSTKDIGPMEFRGFYTAWFWHGVCWQGTLTRGDDDE